MRPATARRIWASERGESVAQPYEATTINARITLAVAAVVFFSLQFTKSEARPAGQQIVTCDNYGCSDWPGAKAAAANGGAKALRGHRRPAEASRARPEPRQRAARGYETIQTAAGRPLTVAPAFAGPAAAVIAQLVAGGYHPKKISGLNFGHGHVRGSLHFSGRAVDVDQCGWGCSPVPRALMRAATAAAGVRDGCEFRDHGHFDNGPHLPRERVIRNCGIAYADAIEPRRTTQMASARHRPSLYEAVSEFKERRAEAAAPETARQSTAPRTRLQKLSRPNYEART